GEERTEEEKGKRKRPRKQPYFVTPADGSVMALAGLYEFWRDGTLPDDHPRAWWATCTVLTTDAESTPLADAPPQSPTPAGPAVGAAAKGPRALADIHPRMPLTLLPDRWDAWLDPARTDPEEIRELLTPPPPGTVRAYPVTRDVSNVRNNGPELVAA
ncbi:SOS response-associated peptidase family protein, partial [Streptomyces lunaelactis]|uniref:SOS response-associated peptidase family protein n=1 Tax=Streptomyces lunaelactis TaxID=1535768 RepID=UPI0015848E03|nr:SOS response-associated peptidase family protein [Streptomyces lunaelactis]